MAENTIVFVIEKISGGGAERVTAALVNEICKDPNYEVHVVVYKKDGKEDYKVDDSVVWHVFEEQPSSRLKAIMNRFTFLRQTVKNIHPTYVVSLGTPRITVMLALAMIGLSCPLILSERNDPSRFPTTKVWRMLRTLAYYLADGVVFQTTQAKDYFSKHIVEKSVVICNPLTSNLLEKYNGERDGRIVNYCRLSPQKNLDLLIDAFYDIYEEFPQSSVHIFGNGPEKEHLERKIVSMNLQEKVYLHDFSTHIHEDIYNASLFVSSSDYEGISNSMLEAIALGIPTICTNCPAGGAGETITDGVNGLLVPVNDRIAMAQAMRKVLSNPNLAKSLSDNGYLLRYEINVTEIAKKWLEFVKIVNERW